MKFAIVLLVVRKESFSNSMQIGLPILLNFVSENSTKDNVTAVGVVVQRDAINLRIIGRLQRNLKKNASVVAVDDRNAADVSKTNFNTCILLKVKEISVES